MSEGEDLFWNTGQKSKIDFFGDGDEDVGMGNGNWVHIDPMISRVGCTLKAASLRTSGSSDILSYESKSASTDVLAGGEAPKPLSISEASKSMTKNENETDVKKLQIENMRLRRKLEACICSFSVKETVKRIVLGEPYLLEPYTSKEEKLELIDEAVSWSDGNAILVTVLFFKKTVKKSLFHREMASRPVALNHYISYLLQRYERLEAVDALGIQGRNEEAAMVMQQLAVRSSSIESKIKTLKSAYNSHFYPNPSLTLEKQIVSDHIALLEHQQPIDKADSLDTANPLLQAVPRSDSLVGKSAMATLQYCSLYHWNEGTNRLASPVTMTRMLKLSDRQYSWAVLMGRSQAQAWEDLNLVLVTKSFLGRASLKGVIPIEKVARILSKYGAPSNVLTTYLKLVENAEAKLTLAKRYRCHELVIDTLTAQRDRLALEQYRNVLQVGSSEHNYACFALQASTKWK